MNVTSLNQPSLSTSRSILKYTEQQLEEVSLDVASVSDKEDRSMPFGIHDGASRDHNYIQAIDSFRIGEYT